MTGIGEHFTHTEDAYLIPTMCQMGFSCDSIGKESPCNAGDLGLIPELGKSPGEGKSSVFWSG